MFQIDEYVVHPTGGICLINKIAPLDMPGADKNRNYYFMVPLKDSTGRVFVPVDTGDAVIRKVMTNEEASCLIDDMPNIKELIVENEKIRETRYKETIKGLDCRELVRLIKSLYARKEKRLSEGKKNTATDEKYFKIAEENLVSEIAFALHRDRKEIFDLIGQRVYAAF